MNKDFHYYGTYYAATFAGYSREEAEEIAWAAQMVDDFTYDNFKDIFDGKKVYYTCESNTDLAIKNLQSLENVEGEGLKSIRRIWVPFHFLPGNIGYQNIAIDETKVALDRDKQDYQCICTPNSELVNRMIMRVGHNSSQQKNIAIGISLHVLSDTWAHQGFLGSPNYLINEVKEISFGTFFERTIPGVSNYSVYYLGHGRIGHHPDYGYNFYSYTPYWSSSSIKVDNRLRFFNAFCQMVETLSYYKGESACPHFDITYRPENHMVKNMSEYTKSILEIVGTEENDQSNAWITTMEKKGFVAPDMYDPRRYGEDAVKAFSLEAQAHLCDVAQYLGEKEVKNYIIA